MNHPQRQFLPIMGGAPTALEEGNTVLQELRQRHDQLLGEIQPLITERRQTRAEFETRLASDDESKRPSSEQHEAYAAEEQRFSEQVTAKLAELRNLQAQVDQETALVRSLEIAQQASRSSGGLEFQRIEAQRDPLTYRRDNQGQFSYFLDLAAHQNQEVRGIPNRKLEGYRERMECHAKEMADVIPTRWEARRHQAEARIDDAERAVRKRHGLEARGLDESPFTRQAQLESLRMTLDMEQRAPSRIVGQGGYAIPPLWLIDEYIPALRPGRVAAGLCRQMPLPEGTDSINIPRLLTPTLTGIQGADAAPVISRDFSDTFQQANVKTIAGQEDVPIQLIEQSPGQILDRVLMTDLIADYNKQVDLQVLTGSGVGAPLSGGQVVGLYPASNWGATTVPTGTAFGGGTGPTVTPAGAEFFQFLGAMASKTAYSRFNLTDFNYILHPRRWFWAATTTDLNGRPLVESSGFSPWNVTMLETDPAPHEGLAGRVPFGPNVYIDANVPTTDNGSGASGGANDVAIGAIWDDLWLFEGDLRTRVLAEVLSGTLELRFQVYAYIAFLARYGVSIALGYGSAMGAPTSVGGVAF